MAIGPSIGLTVWFGSVWFRRWFGVGGDLGYVIYFESNLKHPN